MSLKYEIWKDLLCQAAKNRFKNKLYSFYFKVIQGLEKMTELKEIKINENKIEAISEESFANNYALRIADLGKNAISTST